MGSVAKRSSSRNPLSHKRLEEEEEEEEEKEEEEEVYYDDGGDGGVGGVSQQRRDGETTEDARGRLWVADRVREYIDHALKQTGAECLTAQVVQFVCRHMHDVG